VYFSMEATSRFVYLLDRYFQNEATDVERTELSLLIDSGEYDAELKEKIEAYLGADKGRRDVSAEEAKSALEKILPAKQAKVIALEDTSRSNLRWGWVAAAAMVVASVSIGWFMIGREGDILNAPIAQQQAQRIEASVFSGKQFIRLPDGSTVLLNEDSELSFADTFGGESRQVILKGEAYFDVAHDPSRPFIIKTRNVTTTVLGTAFNVKAYEDDSEVKVTVTRGKVQVANERKTLGTITPDQQIAVNTATNAFVQTNLKAATETVWVDSALILNDVNMAQAATLIEDKFKAKIIFAREDLKECRITAAFLNGESLDQVMKVVSAVVLVEYTVQKDGIVKLDGKGCKNSN
ncbi:MAG: FecR domain-containing protein, partial [Cyclobacteriaceae bacterium]